MRGLGRGPGVRFWSFFLSCQAVDDYGMIGENNQSNGRGANNNEDGFDG